MCVYAHVNVREREGDSGTVSYSFSNSPKWPAWHIVRVNQDTFWN